MHDLVIRGGRIVDGSGAASSVGDIAIDGGVVTAVGSGIGSARRDIVAEGCVVTPGWVDVHTHYDGQVTWDPEVTPSGWHGVTTVVTGNCGVGFAPARAAEREWLIQLMEGVEDIPGTALVEGMTWNWESFPEYLDEVERMPRVLDVAAMLPHGALRAYVLGCERSNDTATEDEIVAMGELAREAIDAGAIGVSTTRSAGHRAKNGEVAAGTYADPAELLHIGSALAGSGRRVFAVVSDGQYEAGSVGDAEFAWMAELSRRNRIPVTYMLHDVERVPGEPSRPAVPGGWRALLDRSLQHNREGAWLVPQVAAKPASVMVGWESSFHPFSSHPVYDDLAELPLAEKLARLRTQEVRDALVRAPHDAPDPFTGLMHEQLLAGNVFPLGDPPNYEPTADQSVKAIAESRHQSVLEVAYDLMLDRHGTELLYWPLTAYAKGNLDNLRDMLVHPASVLGLADGGAHVGIICDGAVPTFMLTHWVRDRARGERIPLELAVHLQTQRPASLFGLSDRGVLAPGRLADVNVIDLEGLRLEGVHMAYDLPGGSKRLVQHAHGYVATIKRGVVVREHDEPTGARPGTLVRGPRT